MPEGDVEDVLFDDAGSAAATAGGAAAGAAAEAKGADGAAGAGAGAADEAKAADDDDGLNLDALFAEPAGGGGWGGGFGGAFGGAFGGRGGLGGKSVPRQMSPTSSRWLQSLEPQVCSRKGQSPSRASVPVQPRSSSQMTPPP